MNIYVAVEYILLDRATLLANAGNRTNDQRRGERVPLVATYHPALNSLGKMARRLHPMLTNSEEHREVFPEPPLIAFRRCKNLKVLMQRNFRTSFFGFKRNFNLC